MSMKKMSAFVFILAVAAPAAFAADGLDALLVRVDGARWGGSAAEAAQNAGTALKADGKIVVASEAVGGTDGTVNYLLSDAGRLYNVSWHTIVPVAEMSRAQALFAEIVAGLTSRHRSPRDSESQGDPAKAAAISSPELAAARERFMALMRDKSKKPDAAAMKEALGGFSPMDMMPSLFYSEQHFWDTRPLRIYASLFCSTDGRVYVHVNFISKRQTGREPYPEGKRKAFSYTPLDRDQDAITAANGDLF